MYTEYFGPVDREDLQRGEPLLEKAARLLQQGEIIAFPTETVYGMGASILKEEAIRQIFTVKKRELSLPLPVQIAHLEQVRFLAKDIPPIFYQLATRFWPGPLTIILKKHSNLSPLITGGKETVAIRFPSDPIAKRIIELTGCPLGVPSANLSRKPSPLQAQHVMEDFNGQIKGVVDGGETEFGLESTVISLEDPNRPTLVRFGVIAQSELEKIISFRVDSHALFRNGFSSNIPLRLFSSWEEMKIYLQLSNDCKRLIMSYGENASLPKHLTHFRLTGKNLYDGLRFASRNGYIEILVLCDSPLKRFEALLNRLKQIAVA